MFHLVSVALLGTGYAAISGGITDPDEVTLLQSTARKRELQASPHHEKQSIAALMESAGNMLKNGATSDVVQFAQATLEEITGVVIPAIENASASDQAWVHTTFGHFDSVLADLELGTALIHAVNAEERSHSTAHKACRDVEEARCTTKITCDYDLYERWLHTLEQLGELDSISGEIHGLFCAPDANGTYKLFRDSAMRFTQTWLTQVQVHTVSHEYYNEKVPDCEHHFAQLDEKTEECDALQTSLEMTACQHAVEVRRVREEFDEAWQFAVETYERVVAEVRILVVDRIQEFRTLSQMQCLLTRTSERNGRPCDETPGNEAEEEMTHCEEVAASVDITWLELVYPEVPPVPPACPDRDSVEGRCMPEPPHYPCSASFHAQEYSMLPAVPQPEFSHENSHCNQRPECQRCEAMETIHVEQD